MSPSGVQADTRVRPDPGRDGTGLLDETTEVLHFLPDTEVPLRRDLAAQIAREQLRQVDELALIGYPTSFDEQTRDVVYETLRLAAERVLDG